MWLSSISPEFVNPLQPHLVQRYIITHRSVGWQQIADCCLQGQGHREGPNPQGIFVRTIYILNYLTFSFLSCISFGLSLGKICSEVCLVHCFKLLHSYSIVPKQILPKLAASLLLWLHPSEMLNIPICSESMGVLGSHHNVATIECHNLKTIQDIDRCLKFGMIVNFTKAFQMTKNRKHDC